MTDKIWEGLSYCLSFSYVRLSSRVYLLKNIKIIMMSSCMTSELRFLPQPYIFRLGKPSTNMLLVFELSFVKLMWSLWGTYHTFKIKITYTPPKYALLYTRVGTKTYLPFRSTKKCFSPTLGVSKNMPVRIS